MYRVFLLSSLPLSQLPILHLNESLHRGFFLTFHLLISSDLPSFSSPFLYTFPSKSLPLYHNVLFLLLLTPFPSLHPLHYILVSPLFLSIHSSSKYFPLHCFCSSLALSLPSFLSLPPSFPPRLLRCHSATICAKLLDLCGW